jgi:hypothetical protein
MLAHHKTVDIPSFVSPIAFAARVKGTAVTIRESISHGLQFDALLSTDPGAKPTEARLSSIVNAGRLAPRSPFMAPFNHSRA